MCTQADAHAFTLPRAHQLLLAAIVSTIVVDVLKFQPDMLVPYSCMPLRNSISLQRAALRPPPLSLSQVADISNPSTLACQPTVLWPQRKADHTVARLHDTL